MSPEPQTALAVVVWRQRMRAFSFAFALLGMLATAQPGAAETVAVLTPQCEEGVDKDLVTHSLRVVARWLRERGLEVVTPEQTRSQVPAHLRQCGSEACALAHLERLRGVDFCVLTQLKGRGGIPGASDVGVTLVTRDGGKYRESWPVTDSTALALDAALTHAYTGYLRGPGPWISLRGTPEGAEVLIDGKKAGVLPYQARIRPGEHRFGVRQEGFEPYERTVLVPKATDAYEQLEVALRELGPPGHGHGVAAALPRPRTAAAQTGTMAEPATEPAQATETQSRAGLAPERHGGQAPTELEGTGERAAPSAWNYVVGGALVAAGAALAGFPIGTAAKHGECTKEVDGSNNCERYEFGMQSAALVAGSVACLAAGAVLLFALPISETSSARLEVGHAGFRFSGDI